MIITGWNINGLKPALSDVYFPYRNTYRLVKQNCSTESRKRQLKSGFENSTTPDCTLPKYLAPAVGSWPPVIGRGRAGLPCLAKFGRRRGRTSECQLNSRPRRSGPTSGSSFRRPGQSSATIWCTPLCPRTSVFILETAGVLGWSLTELRLRMIPSKVDIYLEKVIHSSQRQLGQDFRPDKMD